MSTASVSVQHGAQETQENCTVKVCARGCGAFPHRLRWGGEQQGVISVYQEEKKGKKETAGRTKDKSGSRALDEAWERGQDMEGQVQKESMENRCSENPNWS